MIDPDDSLMFVHLQNPLGESSTNEMNYKRFVVEVIADAENTYNFILGWNRRPLATFGVCGRYPTALD